MQIRYTYDKSTPQGTFSSANLRAAFRSLFSGDLAPFRVRAEEVLDSHEYASDSAAQAEWSGTGVTVTTDGTIKHDGSYSTKLVIDGTGNRAVSRTHNKDISAFINVKLWLRSDQAADTLQFYIKDSSSNESYWNITTNASVDTWEEETLAIASPDSNNGTNATTSDITEWGLRQLTASATLYFDNVRLECGMNVAVEANHDYYDNVFVHDNQPVSFSTQSSPTISAPSSNPRIDILTVNSSGTLAWVTGTEAGSPSPDWSSVGKDVMPIATVYCRTTMAKVVNYEDNSANPNEAYIYSDCRGLLRYNNDIAQLFISSEAQGDILYHDGTNWSRLAAGTSDYVLKTQGAGSNPTWGQIALNNLSDLSTASPSQGEILYYNGTNWVSLGTGTSGQFLKTQGAGANPTWGDASKVKASSDDPTEGYLDAKVDNTTIEESGEKLQVKDGGISQAKLKTSTGSVSHTGSKTHKTLPGGTYGFYPQVKTQDTTTNYLAAIVSAGDNAYSIGPSTSYVTNIMIKTANSKTLYAQQRYITASGPDHWIFLLVANKNYKDIDKNGDILAEFSKGDIVGGYQAPDHPSYGQGEKDIKKLLSVNKNQDIVLVDNDILNEIKPKLNSSNDILSIIYNEYEIDKTSRLRYKTREIIEIDEFGDKEGKVIKKIKTPQWAKIAITKDEIELKRREVKKDWLDRHNIKYKKLKRK